MMRREYVFVYINQIGENEHRNVIQKQSEKKMKKGKLLMHLLLVSK